MLVDFGRMIFRIRHDDGEVSVKIYGDSSICLTTTEIRVLVRALKKAISKARHFRCVVAADVAKEKAAKKAARKSQRKS